MEDKRFEEALVIKKKISKLLHDKDVLECNLHMGTYNINLTNMSREDMKVAINYISQKIDSLEKEFAEV